MPQDSEKTFNDTVRSYMKIREGVRSYTKEFAKFRQLYGLLGDYFFTSGIRYGGMEIKINDLGRKKQYKEISRHLQSLIYHTVPDSEVHVRNEDMEIETIPGIFGSMFNSLSSGKIDGGLQDFINQFSFDDREKLYTNVSSVFESFNKNLTSKDGPEEHAAKSYWDIVYEDVCMSFGAEKFTNLYGLFPEEIKSKMVLPAEEAQIMVLVNPLDGVEQLDTLIGQNKLRLLPWSHVSENQLKEPLDLIMPMDKDHVPFELSEEFLTGIIEDYHFKVGRSIELTKKKSARVCIEAERVKPFNYVALLKISKEFGEFLDETKTEMQENKIRELELSKLYTKK